jgi:hypothetical protein
MAAHLQEYDLSVFINCPFDEDYKPLFDAIVFAVQMTGFRPRCALEAGGQGRLPRIMEILAECRFGIHDLSRTGLNDHGLPRFNMPLELGLDLGCQRFGNRRQRAKRILVMDSARYRYHEFISDISGYDIESHEDTPERVIRKVRDWLSTESGNTHIPGGRFVYARYLAFRQDLPNLCANLRHAEHELTFGDLSFVIQTWLEENEG